MSGEC